MRFRAHYGSNPIVYAQIWEDLQTIPDEGNDSRQANPDSIKKKSVENFSRSTDLATTETPRNILIPISAGKRLVPKQKQFKSSKSQ